MGKFDDTFDGASRFVGIAVATLESPGEQLGRESDAGGIDKAQLQGLLGSRCQERLLEWRTALANVRLPLEIVGYPAAARERHCEELLGSVGLLPFKNAYPFELSGGMKQRVAIVRALAWNPSILLMDEPFSALDELTKNALQDDLLQIWAKERKTVLFVTHNISEAIYLADRVVVMSPHPGRIKTIIPVVLPRPRDEAMRESAAFLDRMRAVRAALRA